MEFMLNRRRHGFGGVGDHQRNEIFFEIFVCTSQKKYCCFFTNSGQLMIFRETIILL
jgi:hypothetical protein